MWIRYFDSTTVSLPIDGDHIEMRVWRAATMTTTTVGSGISWSGVQAAHNLSAWQPNWSDKTDGKLWKWQKNRNNRKMRRKTKGVTFYAVRRCLCCTKWNIIFYSCTRRCKAINWSVRNNCLLLKARRHCRFRFARNDGVWAQNACDGGESATIRQRKV